MTNFGLWLKINIDNINNHIPICKKIIPKCKSNMYNNNLGDYKLANRGIVVRATSCLVKALYIF